MKHGVLRMLTLAAVLNAAQGLLIENYVTA